MSRVLIAAKGSSVRLTLKFSCAVFYLCYVVSALCTGNGQRGAFACGGAYRAASLKRVVESEDRVQMHRHANTVSSNGGRFLLACEKFMKMFDKSFPACVLFCFCFVLLVVGINSRTLIPLFRPGSVHSGSAS